MGVHVKSGRDDGSNAPGLAGSPARVFEIGRDRRKGIGAIGEDVCAAIAVAVGRETQIDRRQELCVPKGSCVASDELFARKASFSDFH